MKIAVMQPYLFPYIGYFQLINAVDVFVLYDDVNYINRGWINRNQVLINNMPHLITMKLSKASQNKYINAINILEQEGNKEEYLNTILQNYRGAPYYEHNKNILTQIVMNKENNLASYILYSINGIVDYLGIKTKIITSSSIKKDTNLKGQNKIIEIVKVLGGNEYINMVGGRALYNKMDFEKNEVKLKYLEPITMEYKQFTDKFHPNLSIIDVLMFNSTDRISELLKNYEIN